MRRVLPRCRCSGGSRSSASYGQLAADVQRGVYVGVGAIVVWVWWGLLAARLGSGRLLIVRHGRVVWPGRRVGFAGDMRALPAWWLYGGLPLAISADFLDWLDMDGRGEPVSST
jgi:hypothetical protein